MKRLLVFVMVMFGVCLGSSEVKAETEWIPVVGSSYVVDTFNGVDAIYTSESNSPADTTYSCAAYVKKYYKQIYGVTVYNLMDYGPLKLMNGGNSIVKVTEPQEGDIIFYPAGKNQNNHSAIVKSFDGSRITLVEQNYKMGKGEATKAAIGRAIDYPSSKYEIWRLSDTSGANIPVVIADVESSVKENVKQQSVLESKSVLLSKVNQESVFVVSKTVMEAIGQLVSSTAAITLVEGGGAKPKVIFDENKGADSYVLDDGNTYSFTVEDDNTVCWYLKDSIFVKAQPKQVVTSSKAYFSFVWKEINFKDVNKKNWAYNAIQKAVDLGIMEGYSDNTFKPDQKISREEFAVMICKALKLDVNTVNTISFSDISQLNAAYIEMAKKYLPDDVTGNSSIGGLFNPKSPVKREEVITALIRMIGIEIGQDTYFNYTDKNQITKGLEVYFQKALDIGITDGFTDNTIKPQRAVTRAEAAAFFVRVFGN